jgi:hypothetical protein
MQPGNWFVKGLWESVVKQIPSIMWAESKLRRETLHWCAAKCEDTKQMALSPIQKDKARPPEGGSNLWRFKQVCTHIDIILYIYRYIICVDICRYVF